MRLSPASYPVEITRDFLASLRMRRAVRILTSLVTRKTCKLLDNLVKTYLLWLVLKN